MNRWMVLLPVCMLIGLLGLLQDTEVQGNEPLGTAQLRSADAPQGEAEAQAAAERAALAEAILAREEAATGRSFDPAFRAATKQRLTGRSVEELKKLVEQEGQGLFGKGGE